MKRPLGMNISSLTPFRCCRPKINEGGLRTEIGTKDGAKANLSEGERLELSSPFGRRISNAVAYQFAYPSIRIESVL